MLRIYTIIYNWQTMISKKFNDERKDNGAVRYEDENLSTIDGVGLSSFL